MSITPLILVQLMFMDLVFLFNETVLVLIIFLLRMLTCNKVDLSCLTEGIKSSYEVIFEMQQLDVAGFRRMRTIT